jgi:hypothetical protein
VILLMLIAVWLLLQVMRRLGFSSSSFFPPLQRKLFLFLVICKKNLARAPCCCFVLVLVRVLCRQVDRLPCYNYCEVFVFFFFYLPAICVFYSFFALYLQGAQGF